MPLQKHLEAGPREKQTKNTNAIKYIIQDLCYQLDNLNDSLTSFEHNPIELANFHVRSANDFCSHNDVCEWFVNYVYVMRVCK